MEKISIHDYANSRVIIAAIPEWLREAWKAEGITEGEDQAQTIFDALGLSSGSCEWMELRDDSDVLHDADLEEMTQGFKSDALASIAEQVEANK